MSASASFTAAANTCLARQPTTLSLLPSTNPNFITTISTSVPVLVHCYRCFITSCHQYHPPRVTHQAVVQSQRLRSSSSFLASPTAVAMDQSIIRISKVRCPAGRIASSVAAFVT